MKTKDLIKMLQEADPSGEIEVNCWGDGDPYTIESLPGHYDGPLFLLKRDPAKLPYYNVVGGKITRKQHKLILKSLNESDVLMDHPELPFEYDADGTGYEMVEKYRAEHRAGIIEAEEWAAEFKAKRL